MVCPMKEKCSFCDTLFEGNRWSIFGFLGGGGTLVWAYHFFIGHTLWGTPISENRVIFISRERIFENVDIASVSHEAYHDKRYSTMNPESCITTPEGSVGPIVI